MGLNLEMRLSTEPKSASMAFASSPLGGSKSCGREFVSVTIGAKLRCKLGSEDDMCVARLLARLPWPTFGGVRLVQKMEWFTCPAVEWQ